MMLHSIFCSVIAGSVLLLCISAGEGAVLLGFCAALVIHESGHIAAAALLGVPTGGIAGGAAGIHLRCSFDRRSPTRNIAMCLAGSLSNLLTAGLAVIIGLPSADGGMYFILTSLTLGGLNLLPISGLDGGAVMSELLSLFMLPDRAWQAERIISCICALAFWCVSVRIQLCGGTNLSMLIMSLYFLYSAGLIGERSGRRQHRIR